MGGGGWGIVTDLAEQDLHDSNPELLRSSLRKGQGDRGGWIQGGRRKRAR